MPLFDHRAYHQHQQRAKPNFHKHDFLFKHVSKELTSRLQDFKASFKEPLILSPHPLPLQGTHDSNLREKLSPSTDRPDLILSCLQAHWINDLPQHLKSIYDTLHNEGLFIGALWGGQTLYELRESLLQAELQLSGGASPRVAPFVLASDAPALLSKVGFFMPVVDIEYITVTYPSINALMKDVRGMGESNILFDRPKSATSREVFAKAEAIYFSNYASQDCKIPATFEILYLTGWKK